MDVEIAEEDLLGVRPGGLACRTLRDEPRRPRPRRDLAAVADGSLELAPPQGLAGLELAPGGEETLWFGARATALGPVEVSFSTRVSAS